ncbi:PTS system beta-glucosides-specific IIC component [Enterococcus sp. PF1-24]|uniref:beta-glucoside-specific PTS transporter subunit IIABC n=1 Tax=unclassified Enterococcus TaxID=2608891 RepID=UPI0024734388|nr:MULTISPECIES: beta-glucoside-specific PTS transporter subunit IIABC [unclassified Enterococcus]MDH6364993.1 PTS system beta-glucosides-specific IIC component [Enterococcus sp. PFB1-1]MDH6402094.1 PTS system beta-glucosides-specific IIC component [Enterococcus sp. PF1-24]
MSKNQEIAKRVLDLVGGEGNVNSVVHCATRLRFNLKDENIAETEKLKANPDVIQVVQSGGQYQVVIGSHVNDVYKELTAISNLGGSSSSEDTKPKGNVLNQLIDIISSIFTPFLGAMAGAGVLKGLLTLASTMGWMAPESGAYVIFWAVADGLFHYLPILLAFTAAKKFDTNPYYAVCIAMALVYPGISALAGTNLSFFGIPIVFGQSGYASSVLPILLATFVLKYVERFAKKVIPNAIKIIFEPLLIFVIMIPLTFIVIGPLGTIVGNLLGDAYNAIYNLSPVIAGAVIGGFWQVFVMFGMHWGLIPIMMLNLGESGVGFDTMQPMLLPAVLAQGGAALAVFLKSKNVNLKGVALSTGLTTIFGITEPAVYGVTLPLKKPFIAACIGGAVGSAFVAFQGVRNYVFGLASVFSLPGFIEPGSSDTSGMMYSVISMVIAAVIAFILTLVLGFDDPVEAATVTEETTENDTSTGQRITLASPVTGNVLPLSEVKDEVFASGAMGKGLAIQPTEGAVYAPVSGEITTIFPTGHAIGITSTDGIELLIHIGMDTVELEGEGFEALVKTGDKINQGDLLVKFDQALITEKGYSTVTPIVVTNTASYLDVLDLSQDSVIHGEDFLVVVK